MLLYVCMTSDLFIHVLNANIHRRKYFLPNRFLYSTQIPKKEEKLVKKALESFPQLKISIFT